MNKRMLSVALFAILLVAVGTPFIASAIPSKYQVTVNREGFSPGRIILYLDVGESITWLKSTSPEERLTLAETNNEFGPVAINWNGQTYTYLFNKAGTYDIYIVEYPNVSHQIVKVKGKESREPMRVVSIVSNWKTAHNKIELPVGSQWQFKLTTNYPHDNVRTATYLPASYPPGSCEFSYDPYSVSGSCTFSQPKRFLYDINIYNNTHGWANTTFDVTVYQLPVSTYNPTPSPPQQLTPVVTPPSVTVLPTPSVAPTVLPTVTMTPNVPVVILPRATVTTTPYQESTGERIGETVVTFGWELWKGIVNGGVRIFNRATGYECNEAMNNCWKVT